MKLDITVIVGIVAIAALMVLLIMLPPGPDHNADNVDTTSEKGEEVMAGVYRMGISSDKSSYEESSKANFTITLTAPKNTTGLIKLWGVKNKYGAYKIEYHDHVNLTAGPNVIEKVTQLPSCSSCAGINPGNFTVYAALYVNDTQIINSSTQIEIIG
jgi:hypothetical protein